MNIKSLDWALPGPFLYHFFSDEVGRGPLAGPVVACTVMYEKSLDSDQKVLSFLEELKVTDSKKLTPKKRANILQSLELDISKLTSGKVLWVNILDMQIPFMINEMDHVKIDELNILQSSLISMAKGPESLIYHFQLENKLIDCCHWVDGNKLPPSKFPQLTQESVVKGDSKFLLMGLASVIAKEYRDYLMQEYENQYPGYGLGQHAGYPTKKHLEAIKELGPSPIHRKSFKGVKEWLHLSN
jgi:ribonuclease HII